MRWQIVFLFFMFAWQSFYGAAPDDIEKTSQRVWYDAVDLNGDGDYTNNPADGTSVATWSDKSGNSLDVSNSGSHRPTYATDSPSASRNGVAFDGSDDALRRMNGDIWSGSVSHSEIFIMATTDRKKNSFIFASMKTHNHRLSSHIPWGNGRTYFDHGQCCGNPARLNGGVSITTGEQYFWHYIADGNATQAVVQDGEVKLSDTNGVGIYTPDSNSDFALAARAYDDAQFHQGKIYEAIFYQTTLNDAQRRIMSAYLSAKWDKPFASTPTYGDVYDGDDSAHGDYDFFVGGIGQAGGAKQERGTSQGLTITDINFLSSNGRFVVAGVNYLLQTPPTGSTTSDLPTGYAFRAQRTWYIDRHGNANSTQIKLSFDVANLGLTVENGAYYSLMRRSGTSGTFARVADTTMQSGKVEFNVLPDDGIYTIAKGMPHMTITKSSIVTSDPVNATSNPKRIPGATVRYCFSVVNDGHATAENPEVKDTLTGNNRDKLTYAHPDAGKGSVVNNTNACTASDCAALTDTSSSSYNNSTKEITISLDAIPANSHQCAYIDVTIQ
jgi:uncharacterized repeat protein (TIGR01451 family)